MFGFVGGLPGFGEPGVVGFDGVCGVFCAGLLPPLGNPLLP
jgi:hypothetical protein